MQTKIRLFWLKNTKKPNNYEGFFFFRVYFCKFVVLFIKGSTSMRKEKALIELRIAGLSKGVHEFTFSCKASDFSDPVIEEPAFTGDIQVRVTAEKTDNEIITAIETVTDAELNCDICLAPVHKRLSGHFTIFFVYGETGHEERDAEEEYRMLPHSATAIDLTEDVRETLLLSLPVKVVCEDYPECTSTQTGEEMRIEGDRAEDSAWKASLEELKRKFH